MAKKGSKAPSGLWESRALRRLIKNQLKLSGERIRELRTDLLMTQAQLAAKARVHEVTLRAIERGTRRNVTVATLIAIAHAVEVPLEHLI